MFLSPTDLLKEVNNHLASWPDVASENQWSSGIWGGGKFRHQRGRRPHLANRPCVSV